MELDTNFWKEQRVLVTGHTGFKGSWLSLYLKKIGATIAGYSLAPPTSPSLFESAGLSDIYQEDHRANICDYEQFNIVVSEFQPTVLFHMAAQALVLDSYDDPLTTFRSNVIGTANVLEASRYCSSLKSIIVVTSDKCYEVAAGSLAYTEDCRLGGYDPYSNSKACAELVTQSFKSSFFNDKDGAKVASVRAGNVIGGGDWAKNRLLPDCYKAFSNNQAIVLRQPNAIRPWQHVLEPVSGYIRLAKLLVEDGNAFSQAWNFGPSEKDALSVKEVADISATAWGNAVVKLDVKDTKLVETDVLMLDSSKAISHLGWQPKWSATQAINKTMDWYKAIHNGADPRSQTEAQIDEYLYG